MKKAFVYIRVSTTDQAEEGYSLGEQEIRLTKYCEAMNWELVQVFSDPAYSGGNMDRPALQEMLSRVKEVDIILVDKLDRLSRSQFDTLYMIQKVFMVNDVAFVSRAEAFDTSTPFGRAMIGILAVFAELERERIKERLMEGKEGRIKEGKFRGGNTVPLGYNYNPDTDILEPDEFEALIVNEIFEMIAQRIPIQTITKKLTEKGYPTKSGGKWQGSTINGMARNKTYIGFQSFKGEWREAMHQPIIEKDLFDQVQIVMDERNRQNSKYKPSKKYTSILGGLCWCANCKAKYQWKKWRTKAVYMCYSRSKSDRSLVKDPTCKNRIFEDKFLEEIVFNEIKKLKVDSYIDSVKRSVDSSVKMDTIKKQIATLNNQISKYMELFTLDGIDKKDVEAKIKPLTQERQLLENEIEYLALERQEVDKAHILSLVSLFEQMEGIQDTSAMHDVVAQLIDYIVLSDDEVQIHWNF